MAEYRNVEPLKKEIADLKRTIHSENTDYQTGYMSALSVVEGMIAEQPAVEVVCCKDCKYWKQERYASSEVYMNCTWHDRGYGDAQPRKAVDFCSYGKRKDNKNAATSEGNTLPEHYKQSLYNAFTGGKG